MTEEDIQYIEAGLLLEGIFQRYGYDFRSYARASMVRRLRQALARGGWTDFPSLQREVLRDEGAFSALLPQLTVTTSEMFRDPSFFKAFREQVVPDLATFPAFRIWHAGCGLGEEVHSLAIILEEEGLYDRATVYATDINRSALQAGREGIYAVDRLAKFTANYHAAGGTRPFSTYYTAAYGAARFHPELRRNIVFSSHNLVSDAVFSEVNVVLCRNVFIYFERPLQNQVFNLFNRSLRYKGHLCLGAKESLEFLAGKEGFRELGGRTRIYRKLHYGAPEYFR